MSRDSQNISINWAADNRSVEVVDSSTGICLKRSLLATGTPPASRLCKAWSFKRFKNLALERQQTCLLRDETYQETKNLATKYQKFKSEFYALLKANGLGEWHCLPRELDNF